MFLDFLVMGCFAEGHVEKVQGRGKGDEVVGRLKRSGVRERERERERGRRQAGGRAGKGAKRKDSREEEEEE